jgi:hypothetical protein
MWHAIVQRSHLGFRFILMSIPIESVRPIFRHLSFANIVFNYISAKFFSIYFSCFCGEYIVQALSLLSILLIFRTNN